MKSFQCFDCDIIVQNISKMVDVCSLAIQFYL